MALVFRRPAHRCLECRLITTQASQLPKPRLNYKDIIENAVYKSHNASNRRVKVPVGAIQSIGRVHARKVELERVLNDLRHQRTTISEQVRTAQTPAIRADAVQAAKDIKEQVHKTGEELTVVEDELLTLALHIPNDSHPQTPLGSEEAAVEISRHGPEPIAASAKRDHIDVGRALSLFDFDSASVVTGTSWYYLMNEAVFLEQALINYALSIATKYGYTPVATPDVVRSDIAWRCGFQPRENEDASAHSQTYHVQTHTASADSPSLSLTGTAEIPLAGLFANKLHPAGSLPLKVVGVGKSFRAEAGAKGTDTRGLYRVHQFTKVELFAVVETNQSEEVMEELKKIQIDIFSGLGLTFRLLDMPTEELGASAYRKYDIEAWMPGRNGWGEISSTSNCTDYQSRRLHIRYRPSISEHDGPLPFAHTLNGTAAAIPRLIVALIENGVKFDENDRPIGISLPLALKPFWINSFSRDIIHWSLFVR